MFNPLIVAAAPFEIDHTVDKFEKLNIEVEPFICGIGPINAAKSTHLLKSKAEKREVFFLGTCGIFSKFRGIELIKPKKVFWLPLCERLHQSEAIEEISPPIDIPNKTKFTENLKPVDVICCPNISLNSKLPNDMIASNTVENLELYSCIDALLSAKSLTVILAVTNQVGAHGREQWKNNFKSAATLIGDHIEAKLTTINKGE